MGAKKKLYNALWHFLSRFFPVLASKILYKRMLHKRLNLKEPKTLNEKLMFLKLYKYSGNELVAKCADKYKVREYVAQKDCAELLNGLIGVWENPDDIDFDSLPSKFVLKCNHGSGFNIICSDKDILDTESVKKQLKKWLKTDYGYDTAEMGIYKLIPRNVICEEYIETSDGLPPADYKIFCSNGVPKLIFVATDRINDNTRFDYYTTDWKWIPVANGHPNNGDIREKPPCLDEMLGYAAKLSEGFPLVRVDFYEEKGKIIFGELTFTHFGCIQPFIPDKYDYEFGTLFPIEQN